MSVKAAAIETLTAEVRVLMVGSRQVTLSVYAQLDQVHPDTIIPFGRVRTRDKNHWIAVVGTNALGNLCGSHVQRSVREQWDRDQQRHVKVTWFAWPGSPGWMDGFPDEASPWWELPLIVLAGLR